MSKRDRGSVPRRERRPLVSESVAAELLGVKVRSLRQARYTGEGFLGRLNYYKLGTGKAAPVRYDPNELDALLDECHVVPESSGP
jgi:hypothetical protein